MVRFAMTLLFAIFMAGASMVHFARATERASTPIETIQTVDKCSKERANFSSHNETSVDCEVARTHSSTSQRRCHLDVGPLTTLQDPFAPITVAIREQYRSNLINQGNCRPELHPPQSL